MRSLHRQKPIPRPTPTATFPTPLLGDRWNRWRAAPPGLPCVLNVPRHNDCKTVYVSVEGRFLFVRAPGVRDFLFFPLAISAGCWEFGAAPGAATVRNFAEVRSRRLFPPLTAEYSAVPLSIPRPTLGACGLPKGTAGYSAGSWGTPTPAELSAAIPEGHRGTMKQKPGIPRDGFSRKKARLKNTSGDPSLDRATSPES